MEDEPRRVRRRIIGALQPLARRLTATLFIEQGNGRLRT